MIICPNLSNPEVAREFDELIQATSEQAAYHIWSLNNGNAIDRAPNGAPSKLFQTLLEYYGGDRTKAIQAKAKTYGKSFLEWFGDWTEKYKILAKKGRAGLAYEMEEDALQKINPEYVLLYRAIRKKSLELNHVPRRGEYSYEQLLADAGLQKYISTEYYAIDIKEDVQFSLNSNYDEARIDLVDLKRKHPELDLQFEKFQTVTSEGLELIKGFQKQDITQSIYDNLYALNDVSKVVDENGEPLPAWHGGYLTDNDSMPDPTYTEEVYDEWGEPFPGRELNPGIWFTTDKEYVNNFSSQKYLCFLNIKHPYYGDNLHSSLAADIKDLEDNIVSEEDIMAAGGKTDGLIGHDIKTWGGATIEEMKNDPRFAGPIPKLSEGVEFAIYYPNQAKSVDNEGPTLYEGTFSKENSIFDQLKRAGAELMKKCNKG